VHNFIIENTPITNAQMNSLEIKAIKSGIDVDRLVETYCYGYHQGLMSETNTPEQVGFQSVNSLIANSLFEEEDVWDKPSQTQRHRSLSPVQKAKAKARAAAAGRPYPNMIDNMWAVNEENINEISNELVGRVNKLRTLGPNPGSGVPPKPHKTLAGAKTLQTAINKVRFKSKVGAPPMKEDVDTAFGAMIEAKDKGEYDYEGDMSMSQLRSIMHNAQQIHDMLEPNTNMPEWVQSKITLAADYISTCADYLASNKDA
jgi:hypothetical protein